MSFSISPTLSLLCLLSLAYPASASKYVIDYYVTGSNPLSGTETVHAQVLVRNSEVESRVDPQDPNSVLVFTTTNAAVTVSKYEEYGGYAYGIAYRVNGGDRHFVLYSFANNGSTSLGTFAAGTTLELQMYRFVLLARHYIGPEKTCLMRHDTTGPTISLAPVPGTYQRATVAATVTDDGSGIADDLEAVISYTVRIHETGALVSEGSGTTIVLEVEGRFDISFTASDLLGNRSTSPPDGGDPNTYTIDGTPPVLSNVTTSVTRRADSALDVAIDFALRDAGAGVAPETVAARAADDQGSTWQFVREDITIVSGADGGFTASMRVPAVPLSARLSIHIEAKDLAGNLLSYDMLPVTMPPEAVQASVLASGVSGDVADGVEGIRARYRIPIAFDRPGAMFAPAGVASYRLTRAIGAVGVIETVVELGAAEFASRLVDLDGAAVYWDTVIGRSYAHQSITYALETFFSANGSETSPVSGSAAMPNIRAWQVAVVRDGATLMAYRSGAGHYSELRIRSFEGVAARIGDDPEGDSLAMRLEYIGPGGRSGTVPPEGWTREVVFSNAIAEAPDGTYQVRWTVDESIGGEYPPSPWAVIKVDRTYGEITGDTEWLNDLTMGGSVAILSGGRLRIGDGVKVHVANAIDPVTGGPLAITVCPGGTLDLAPGSLIESDGWRTGSQAGIGWEYWAGILAEAESGGNVATVRIAGTIRGALRGVTVCSGADVRIEGASIEQCRTGVHAIGQGADPVIDRSAFTANARYGIKEDLGASPLVTSCVFDANTYDYYDNVLTAVDAEGINGLRPENSGNAPAGGSP